MSKLFRTQNTGASQTTEATQNEKIKIYDTSADLTADLANLAENEIVAIKEVDNYNEPVDVIEDGNMHAVTSNAVADALTYSTTENAVGTWIDGKPIYRRTFEFTATADNQHATILPSGATAISCQAIGIRKDGRKITLPYMPADNFSYVSTVYMVEDEYVFRAGTGFTADYLPMAVKLTVEYTKA